MVSANVGPWIWNGTPVPGPGMSDNMTTCGNQVRVIDRRILCIILEHNWNSISLGNMVA